MGITKEDDRFVTGCWRSREAIKYVNIFNCIIADNRLRFNGFTEISAFSGTVTGRGGAYEPEDI